jgi:hypothetical protein
MIPSLEHGEVRLPPVLLLLLAQISLGTQDKLMVPWDRRGRGDERELLLLLLLLLQIK